MPIANELTVDTGASAMDMAQTIFGAGVQVVKATYSGDPASAGIYSDAQSTIAGVTNSNSGVILSTGYAANFTNSSGTTNTNTQAGMGNDVLQGIDNDTDLNSSSGQTTFDGAILQADFIPTGDMLTMQFVFTSEEYPEYVLGGVNDSFGVWVNGQFVQATIAVGGRISIDTVNPNANTNLYQTNGADQFNTEMDGITYTLSFKAPVNAGQINTIKIGIADGGDAVYDSNVLISADSIQTVALALDDHVQLAANSTRVVDVLANDRDLYDSGLTVTHIMGQPATVGTPITLGTGEQVTLNADGTLTVTSDGDIGSNVITYQLVDGLGNTDVGYLTIHTVGTAGPDGIVQGTAGGDLIDTSYLGDPDGDRVDNLDATGVYGTTGQDDYILAGAGNDTVLAGDGNDYISGGTGDDSIDGGAGNDTISAGEGNDTVLGQAGNDTVYLGAGNDVFGSTGPESQGDDTVYGGSGNDTLIGDLGNDVLYGEADRDVFTGTAGDTIYGGEEGDDFDTLVVDGIQSITYASGDTESGTISLIGGGTVTFSGIETIQQQGSSPDGLIWGTNGAELIGAGYIDANGDIVDNNDAILSNPGSDDDEIYGMGGNDTIQSLQGHDYVYGGDDDDLIQTGVGNDYAQGDTGNDTVEGGDGDDFLRGDAGNDYVYGGAGNDSVYGGSGVDHVYGGDGDDYIYGGYGDDTVYGGAGNDTITGSGESDEIHGDDGDDYMQGSNGADTMYGGLGADTMLGEEDADTFYGGAGDYVDGYETITTGTDNDTLHVDDVDHVTYDTLNPENGVVHFNGGGTLQFFNIENLVVNGTPMTPPDYIVEGTAGADLIDAAYLGDPEGDRVDANDNLGANNDDLIQAGAGNDTVMSLDGNDTVYGDSGDDDLQSGVGNDVLYGGTGNDAVDGGAGDDRVVLESGFGNDTVIGGELSETLGDTLDASAITGDVTLDLAAVGPGNAEDGTLSLGGDTVSFSEIENIVLGSGNDAVIGSAGADHVATGAGADTVTGGAGNDVFDLGADTDRDVVVLADGHGNDSLTGFDLTDSGDGTTVDQLDVSGLTSDAGTTPVNTSNVVVTDTNGDGTGDAILTFPGGESITLVGVLAAQVDSPAELQAIGIPAPAPVDGTAGADLMNPGYTDAQGDQIDGTDGLNDTIFGYDGNDTINSGAGDDLVYGGAGNDVLRATSGNDTLYGDQGDDDLQSGSGDDLMYGGDGGELFHTYANSDDDTVVGGETNDSGSGDVLDIDSATAAATVTFTGDEAGTVSVGTSTVTFSEIETIWTDAGNDTIDGTAATTQIRVSANDGDDSIIGGSGSDNLLGGLGNDTVYGGAGNDSVYGGWGEDQLYGGAGNDQIQGSAGNDLLHGDAGNDWIQGGDDNDTVYGGTGNDLLQGDGGNDSLIGDDGDDSLWGGLGDDTLIGGQGNDNLQAGAGADSVYGGDGDDHLDGGDGADSLNAGAGDDVIFGGLGDDTIIGFEGSDTAYGGDGNDLINTRTSPGLGAPDVGLVHPTNSALSYPADLDPNNDRDFIGGGAGNDTILSGDDDDTIYGGDGDDSIEAGFDDDLVYGETNNDTIEGNEGADTLYGGDGDDLIFGGLNPTNPDYALSTQYDLTDDIDPDAQNNADSLFGGAGNDVLFGGDDGDTIDGGIGNDVLDGGIDDDRLMGGDGDDSLYGGAGNDILQGDDGNDALYGGTGNDTFEGGAGADVMEGGDDRDVFFGGIGDTVDGGDGGDDQDTLDLSGYAGPVNVIYDPMNTQNGTVQFLDGLGAVVGTMEFSEIENLIVPCFTPGALIATNLGERRVEELRIGDQVLTRDNGYQEIRWIGRRDLTPEELVATPKMRPVRIGRGALGLNLPELDLVVSPQHRMLIASSRAELLFGEHEVLVPAGHMLDRPGIVSETASREVSYIHLLFDQHEVIRANGAWSESYQPGELTLAGMDDGPRNEILALFPQLRLGYLVPAARVTLKKQEAKLLFAH
ncbi:MAG: Hint domain-containing protein [Paracoccaceae bacterium]